jgi:hypothetical protein
MHKNKGKQLLILCEKFVNDQEISCSESVYQSDRVIDNSCELIEQICEIVGYFHDPDEEEDNG